MANVTLSTPVKWLQKIFNDNLHKHQRLFDQRDLSLVRSGHLGETWALLGRAGVAGGTSGAAGAGQHQCDAGGATCTASCIFSQKIGKIL